jgi:hypothetical protein
MTLRSFAIRASLVAVVVALAVPAAAFAASTPPPITTTATPTVSPNVLACCDNGGPVATGCKTAEAQNSDAYGNTVKAFASWCWDHGKVTWFSGGNGVSLCGGSCSFAYWNYAYPFAYGYTADAFFDDAGVNIFGVKWSKRSEARACVNVDGWGDSWEC